MPKRLDLVSQLTPQVSMFSQKIEGKREHRADVVPKEFICQSTAQLIQGYLPGGCTDVLAERMTCASQTSSFLLWYEIGFSEA
jgi:hypothetical protein